MKAVGLPGSPSYFPTENVAKIRAQLVAGDLPVDNVPDDAIRAAVRQRTEDFAPTGAAEAATTIILDGVKAGHCRTPGGADAEAVDTEARATPVEADESDFVTRPP